MTKLFLVTTAILAAVPAYAESFQGFHADATAGYDRVSARLSDGVDSIKAHKGGLVYGVSAGWDFRSHGVVFGPYAGVDLSTVKECTEVLGNDRVCAKAKRNFEVGGRFGGVVGKQALIYGKVAYVNGRATIRYSDFITPANNFSLSANRDGFRLGAGVEYALSPTIYLLSEYRYTRYKTSHDGSGVSLRVTRNQLVGGAGFRF